MKPYTWFRFLAVAARAQQDRWREWLARDPGLPGQPPMPQRIPLGDTVPEEWVAEYRRQDRGQP